MASCEMRATLALFLLGRPGVQSPHMGAMTFDLQALVAHFRGRELSLWRVIPERGARRTGSESYLDKG
jgi:hypothetical protein